MNKAQGSLEYLLLIGGSVLVSVIVITTLLGIMGSQEEAVTNTSNTAFDRIRDAREGISPGDYVVKFEADGASSSGTCTDPMISVWVTVNGTQVGNQIEIPFDDPTKTSYTIIIPSSEVSSGTRPFVIRHEDNNPTCPWPDGDKNIRIYEVSISNSDGGTNWERYSSPVWNPWPNDGVTIASCSWSDCVRANVTFN